MRNMKTIPGDVSDAKMVGCKTTGYINVIKCNVVMAQQFASSGSVDCLKIRLSIVILQVF